MTIPIVIFAVWALSTFFESWHDWHLHCKLYKPGATPQDKDKLKTLDGLEKAVFLAGFSMWVWADTGDLFYVGLVVVWQVFLRWIGHEAWYSWFSRSPFGRMGVSSPLDRFITRLGLGNTGNAVLLTLPVIVLTMALVWLSGGK